MNNKFNNKKTEVDGIKFDSKREAKRYSELKLLEQGHVIQDLRLQVPFELIPKVIIHGKPHRAIVYKADFVYFDNEKKQQVIEDSKGFKTDVYSLKKRLMKQVHNIEILES